jgi:hypothetical protein
MMNRLNSLISVFISLIYINSGVFAQREYSPSAKRYFQIKTIQKNLTYDEKIFQNYPEIPDQIDALCQPTYIYGCSDNDGFTDFALEQIQNLSNGCDDNTGNTGWSEYYTLGPASLAPGSEYNFIMATGFSNQHVNIWIDFNDDLVLTPNEIILYNYIMLLPGILYNVQVTIPGNAPAGQHAMRAMAVWPDAFNDPCGSYLYGEAEDYYVQIETGVYGNLEGYITQVSGGAPIEGAFINVGDFFSATSGNNGYYYVEHVLVGTWSAICSKEGFNIDSVMVTISPEITSTQDFQLTAPQIALNPTTVSVTIEQNAFTTETINISNSGNGNLEWIGNIVLTDSSGTDEQFDLQFDWPVGVGGGEAGIECDGNYIYTSKWNGTSFYKYELDGTYIGPFTCGSAGSVRDMAFDGTYFYGAAANNTVFQMDFTNGVLVSQFTAPTDIRAIAFNEDENTFYGNNWDTDITNFNIAGANLGSFPVGPIGASYYGFAYDNYSSGAPCLWGYAQTGPTLNELIQIQLPSGVETGTSFDVGSIAAVGTGLAGGLAITDKIVLGFYTLLGTAQNIDIWGLELCESSNYWLSIAPGSGAIAAGQNQDMILHFNATDLIPGYYFAEILFSTNPNVGSPVVDVTMHIEGLIPATNLNVAFDCTDVILTWEMPFGGAPDSWNVYRDGILIENSTILTYIDPMVDPEVEYSYFVKAVYAGEESLPTATETISVPAPANLEPLNPEATFQGNNTVEISWEAPEACLAPGEYYVYRYNTIVGSSTTLSYTDTGVPYGYYEYYIKAVYYFGESGNSDPAGVLVGIDEMNAGEFRVFPNPASNHVIVKSLIGITNIKVLNNSGQLVIDNEVNGMQFRIDLSKLKRGVYYIKLETLDGEMIKKIIVNHFNHK